MNDKNIIIKRDSSNVVVRDKFCVGLGVLITVFDYANNYNDEKTFQDVSFWLSCLGFSVDESKKMFPNIKIISNKFIQNNLKKGDGGINV